MVCRHGYSSSVRSVTRIQLPRMVFLLAGEGARSIVAALSGTPVWLANLRQAARLAALCNGKFMTQSNARLLDRRPARPLGSTCWRGRVASSSSTCSALASTPNRNCFLWTSNPASRGRAWEQSLTWSPLRRPSPLRHAMSSVELVSPRTGSRFFKLRPRGALIRLASHCAVGRACSGPRADHGLSPDGKEIIIPRMVSSMTDENPFSCLSQWVLSLCRASLTRKGLCNAQKPSESPGQVPTFLRLLCWPRASIWNHSLAVVEVGCKYRKILTDCH